MTAPILELSGVVKDYRALRPLRIAALSVQPGARVALVGLDQVAAEVFTNLVTGAILPETGDIRVFGRPTSAIADSDDWLATVDRFGIVSERAVLLEQLTVVQNLAMPFTLDIEPPPPAERVRAETLAREVGVAEPQWAAPLAGLDPLAAMRVRLGRAVALGPAVVLLEHASASLSREASAEFAASVRAVADRRRIAVIALTADESFARGIGATVLAHEPATGRLKESGRGWFGRRR